jgi:GNAT superfamily N-acetyltransferase
MALSLPSSKVITATPSTSSTVTAGRGRRPGWLHRRAKAGDEPIGYSRTAWFEPDPAAPANAAPAGYFLIGLVVDPSWRRRGVASALINARLAWVAQRASEAWYFADVLNRVSIQLHERAGLRRSPTTSGSRP